MAQLPPKIPTTMPPIWANFGLQRPPFSIPASGSPLLPTPSPPAPGSQHSWVDEFLDFSSAKRSSHRRSASDSITFVEAAATAEFDGLDDHQLMSMFPDDVPPSSSPSAGATLPVSSSNPSTPSDHNSINDDKPATLSDQLTAVMESAEEAQSARKAGPPAPAQAQAAAGPDPKRVKRILANRQSAQRSRVRKLQYISELERSVTTLQTEVSALSPRVAFLDHQRSILTVGNSHLKQRIAALAQDKIFKDAHQEALRNEIERLKQVYRQQNLKRMPAPTSDHPMRTGKELAS
ncbi:basic leucine zipper 61-like [Phoenix dactylifera]|uniref:Basic leucine zipper 61-like n=1 Tax=Phoenix dactylifera TaxID=42345 RepID=A0A8B7C6W3_PHODC|nr:basic leucine zipper 61-like [Phoenix dactylifera]